MLKKLTETTVQEVKEDMMAMLYQIETINRGRNFFFKPNGNSGVDKYSN